MPVFQPPYGSGGCPKRQPKARFVRARQGCELEAHRLEAIERTRRSFCGRHGRVERVKLSWHWPRRWQSNLAHFPRLGRETAELASRSVIALDFFSKAHLACGARARTGARHSAGPGHMQVNNAHFRSLAYKVGLDQRISPRHHQIVVWWERRRPAVDCILPAQDQARPWRQAQVRPGRGE